MRFPFPLPMPCIFFFEGYSLSFIYIKKRERIFKTIQQQGAWDENEQSQRTIATGSSQLNSAELNWPGSRWDRAPMPREQLQTAAADCQRVNQASAQRSLINSRRVLIADVLEAQKNQKLPQSATQDSAEQRSAALHPFDPACLSANDPNRVNPSTAWSFQDVYVPFRSRSPASRDQQARLRCALCGPHDKHCDSDMCA